MPHAVAPGQVIPEEETTSPAVMFSGRYATRGNFAKPVVVDEHHE